MKKSIKEGDRAPGFELPDSYEDKVSLGTYAGKWVVLYFYPKDSTSGCTTEALDFTSRLGDFEKLGAAVIGISPDSCKSHKSFVIKYDLGVRLLSDQGSKVCAAYGVWQTKKMYGREYKGVVRTTFLIDPRGMIRRIWDKVKVQGHGNEVLDALRELAK